MKNVNLQCADLSPDQRQDLFNSFYKMDLDSQNPFLIKSVQSRKKTINTIPQVGKISKPRSVSRHYFLNEKKVCKELFLSTFSISNGRLQRTLKKFENNPNIIPKDGRGKHGHQPTNYAEAMTELTQILDNLPKYVSHYGRKDSMLESTVYLQPGLMLTCSK